MSNDSATFRAARVTAAVAAVTLLVGLAGAAWIAFFFDANAYKPRVTAAVQQQLGRALAIDGPLTVSLLPAPHAVLNDVRLSSAPGFGDEPFARAKSVAIHVNPLPLLRRRLEIIEVVLEQPRVHLQRSSSGSDNWADLRPQQETNGSGRVMIHGIRILDGELILDDEQANRHAIVSALDLTARNLAQAAPAEIESTAEVRAGQSAFNGVLKLSARAAASRDAGLVSGRLEAALTDKSAELARAEATATPAPGRPARIEAKLDLPEFSPRLFLEQSGRTVPATRDPTVLSSARLKVEAAGDRERLVVHMKGQLDDSELDGRITAEHWWDDPAIRFLLLVDGIDLDRYRPQQLLEPPSPDSQDAISKISNEELRALGLDIRGELRVGSILLNGDRTDNFVSRLEWNP